MLLVRAPANSRLLVVKFWESPKLYVDFQLRGEWGMGGVGGVSSPNPRVAQGLTVQTWDLCSKERNAANNWNCTTETHISIYIWTPAEMETPLPCTFLIFIFQGSLLLSIRVGPIHQLRWHPTTDRCSSAPERLWWTADCMRGHLPALTLWQLSADYTSSPLQQLISSITYLMAFSLLTRRQQNRNIK